MRQWLRAYAAGIIIAGKMPVLTLVRPASYRLSPSMVYVSRELDEELRRHPHPYGDWRKRD